MIDSQGVLIEGHDFNDRPEIRGTGVVRGSYGVLVQLAIRLLSYKSSGA